MPNYYLQYNIGHAKYVINTHDGKTFHPDGSPFYGIKIFKNKKELAAYVKYLKSNGYKER